MEEVKVEENVLEVSELKEPILEDEEGLVLVDDLSSIFDPQAVASLDDAAKQRITHAVNWAIYRKESTKPKYGKKVKRVPGALPTEGEVAASAGLTDIAKILDKDRPKPFFPDFKKDEESGVTKTTRVTHEFINTNFDNAFDNLPMRLPNVTSEKTSIFGTIEHLEGLIGKYTSEKLAVERKLRMANKALEEAYFKLEQSNVTEIVTNDKT